MLNQKISSLLAFSLVAAPIVLPTATQANHIEKSIETSSVRSSNRRMRQQLAAPAQISPIGTYVGELQEKWKFPSDHLPIGMTFEDFDVLSFNVLDADYMSWVIEKNSQGLSRSMIADEHVYIGDSGLTFRDQHVVNLILQAIANPNHPRSILALQECSKPFLQELCSKLPPHFEVVSHFGEALVIDRNRFEVVDARAVTGIFSDFPFRAIQDVQLRRLDTGASLRIVNAHLPGDPLKPARFEFGHYLSQTLDPSTVTLAMGDMNFNEREMQDALDRAFEGASLFSVLTPYCTNISPYEFVSKAIDHFLVYSPDPDANISSHSPEEVMDGLGKIAALLEGEIF